MDNGNLTVGVGKMVQFLRIHGYSVTTTMRGERRAFIQGHKSVSKPYVRIRIKNTKSGFRVKPWLFGVGGDWEPRKVVEGLEAMIGAIRAGDL